MRNACGQRALATLLDLARIGRPPLSELYASHPPDTLLKLFGTSPRALARMCVERGLDVRHRAGGDGARARAWLARELEEGRAVALLLDLRHLGRPWPTGHWVVALDADERAVQLTNLVRTPRFASPDAGVPWETLLPAWRCAAAILPSWRYAAVSAPRA